MTITVLQINTLGIEQLNNLSKVIQLVSDKQETKSFKFKVPIGKQDPTHCCLCHAPSVFLFLLPRTSVFSKSTVPSAMPSM